MDIIEIIPNRIYSMMMRIPQNTIGSLVKSGLIWTS
jgi:hypothetical protein